MDSLQPVPCLFLKNTIHELHVHPLNLLSYYSYLEFCYIWSTHISFYAPTLWETFPNSLKNTASVPSFLVIRSTIYRFLFISYLPLLCYTTVYFIGDVEVHGDLKCAHKNISFIIVIFSSFIVIVIIIIIIIVIIIIILLIQNKHLVHLKNIIIFIFFFRIVFL